MGSFGGPWDDFTSSKGDLSFVIIAAIVLLVIAHVVLSMKK